MAEQDHIPSRPAPFRKSIWLFPATYLLHISEELWGGSGFALWISRVAGVRMTTNELVIANAAGLVAMTIGLFLVRRFPKWRWVLTALAAIILMNAALHAIGTVVTWSYSPGLVTAVILWVPLGSYTLIQEWRCAARSTFFKGLIGALVFHVLMVLTLAAF